MSQKNFRTLDGIYKALLKQKTPVATDYNFFKGDGYISISYHNDPQKAISGVLIEKLMPVLRRTCWMARHNYQTDGIDLLIWVYDDTI